VLGISVDELVGANAIPKTRRAPEGRLWHQFRELEDLPPQQRRQVVQIMDAFLERERLRESIRSQAK
jgi:hypothetical protein